MELYVCVLIGAFIYLAFSWNEIYGKPEFKWKIFFECNLGSTVLNVLCGFVIVWRREDISQWFPITGIVAVFLGTSGQLIWKKLSNMFNSKVDTYIGINK